MFYIDTLTTLFSAPEPKAQVHYCDHVLSVVRPSVCPSIVLRKLSTCSTSSLKPLNRIQRNLTGINISTSSSKFVFFGPIGKTRWPPWPLIGWDIFDVFSETAEQNSMKLDRKQDLNVLYQICFFFSGRSEKQDGGPGLWLAEKFSTSSLKPLNWIQQNMTGINISTSSTKSVFFGPIGKTRWPPWPLIGWDIFDFFSETAERNSTKLDRKQDLKRVLPRLCFSSRWINKNCRPGRSGVKKVAHCTQVHDMWPFGPLVLFCFYFRIVLQKQQVMAHKHIPIETWLEALGLQEYQTGFSGYSGVEVS